MSEEDGVRIELERRWFRAFDRMVTAVAGYINHCCPESHDMAVELAREWAAVDVELGGNR